MVIGFIPAACHFNSAVTLSGPFWWITSHWPEARQRGGEVDGAGVTQCPRQPLQLQLSLMSANACFTVIRPARCATEITTADKPTAAWKHPNWPSRTLKPPSHTHWRKKRGARLFQSNTLYYLELLHKYASERWSFSRSRWHWARAVEPLPSLKLSNGNGLTAPLSREQSVGPSWVCGDGAGGGMKPWIVHHLYCSVSLINLQYKMISCPGHKTERFVGDSQLHFPPVR